MVEKLCLRWYLLRLEGLETEPPLGMKMVSLLILFSDIKSSALFRNRLDESFPKSTNLPYVSPMVAEMLPSRLKWLG
jgi:hypothetical protein